MLRGLEETWDQDKEAAEYGDCVTGVYSKDYTFQKWVQVGNRWSQPYCSRLPSQLGQARPEHVNTKTSLPESCKNLESPRREKKDLIF